MVVIFHKHIVLSVKLRKSERMNVSHKIPTARMHVYSDSDKKYFYMHDLTDKFVCAHCMHACRIPTGPTADLRPIDGRPSSKRLETPSRGFLNFDARSC